MQLRKPLELKRKNLALPAPARPQAQLKNCFAYNFLAILILLTSSLIKGDEILVIPQKLVMKTAKGKSVSVMDFAKSKHKRNLLLVFFRTGNCGICVHQLEEFAENFSQIESLNATVLAVSMDDAIVQTTTSQKIEGKYPILLDPDGKVTKQFGVYNPEENMARPSLFLIGPDKKVQYSYVGHAIQDRPTLSVVLEMLRHYSGKIPEGNPRAVSSPSGK